MENTVQETTGKKCPYQAPETEIIYLLVQDVIRTSNTTPEDPWYSPAHTDPDELEWT